MKNRILAFILATILVLGMVSMFSCGSKNPAENNTKIVIGASGPLTEGAAMYGEAVKNSAILAIEQINSLGGVKGIEFVLDMKDDKNNPNLISANYASLYEGGMQVSLGTVTTKPGLEFKNYAKEDNVFFITPSATGDKIAEFANGYQMCFADSDQGTVSAGVFNELYKGKTVGIFFKSDDEYSVGIKNNFVAALDKSFGDVKTASFNDDTAADFTQQIAELKDLDVIFMPIYYGPAALFMKQGNGIVNDKAVYYGCDGLDGIDKVDGFDINSIPQSVSYLSHFNSNAEDGTAAYDYIQAYRKKFGNTAPLNQFGAAAYDCVYSIYHAMLYAIENNGAEITAGISASDLCDILTAVYNDKNFEFRGITGAPEADGSSTITWTDANGQATNGHVNKAPVSYTVK